MDIGKLNELVEREEEAIDIPIYDRAGEPLLGADGEQCTICVVGADSKAVRAAERQNTRRQLRTRGKLNEAQVQEARINRAAAAICGWTGFEENGKPYPFTPENARTLLAIPFIFRQVEEGMQSHADFFGIPSSD